MADLELRILSSTLSLSQARWCTSPSFGKLGDLLPASLNRTTKLVDSFKNGPASIYTQLFQIWKDARTALSESNIPGQSIQYLIQPQAVTDGTSVVSLGANQTNMVPVTLTVLYDDVADDTVALGALNNIVTAQTELLKQAGLYNELKYLTYADIGQDVFGSTKARTRSL
ncbi:hypothetical protein BDW67DRAFT_188570 [Aspergillus spinulosporus]